MTKYELDCRTEKKEKIQITKIRNENGDSVSDLSEIKRIIREYTMLNVLSRLSPSIQQNNKSRKQ